MKDESHSQPESVKVELSDGTFILMEINNSNNDDHEISIQEMEISAKRAFRAMASLSTDLKDILKKAKPDKATAEFSVELEKKGGDILSKICNVSGKGSVKFTLEWNFKNKEASSTEENS